MSPYDVDRSIAAAVAGTGTLSGAALNQVLSHVSRAGFDPRAMERARGGLAGIRWQGAELHGRDRVPPAVRHFLKHVVKRREWPAGTSLAGYLQSLQEVVNDPASGVFTSRYQGEPQFGVVRESRALRGPEGFDWVLLEYRVATGYWVTAYQPRGGLQDLESSVRTDLRWWREPERTSV